jgi:hypothetical protein
MNLNDGVPKIGVRHKFEEPTSTNIFVIINAQNNIVALVLMGLESSLKITVKLFTWGSVRELEGTHLLLVSRGEAWGDVGAIDGEESGTAFGRIAKSEPGPASVTVCALA